MVLECWNANLRCRCHCRHLFGTVHMYQNLTTSATWYCSQIGTCRPMYRSLGGRAGPWQMKPLAGGGGGGGGGGLRAIARYIYVSSTSSMASICDRGTVWTQELHVRVRETTRMAPVARSGTPRRLERGVQTLPHPLSNSCLRPWKRKGGGGDFWN